MAWIDLILDFSFVCVCLYLIIFCILFFAKTKIQQYNFIVCLVLYQLLVVVQVLLYLFDKLFIGQTSKWIFIVISILQSVFTLPALIYLSLSKKKRISQKISVIVLFICVTLAGFIYSADIVYHISRGITSAIVTTSVI